MYSACRVAVAVLLYVAAYLALILTPVKEPEWCSPVGWIFFGLIYTAQTWIDTKSAKEKIRTRWFYRTIIYSVSGFILGVGGSGLVQNAVRNGAYSSLTVVGISLVSFSIVKFLRK